MGRQGYRVLGDSRRQEGQMSSIELTPRMAWLLETLRDFPLTAEQVGRLRDTPEWSEAAESGWVTESGEISGTGLSCVRGQGRSSSRV
jgi:hypothetical protein